MMPLGRRSNVPATMSAIFVSAILPVPRVSTIRETGSALPMA